jgi:hypothetical protein
MLYWQYSDCDVIGDFTFCVGRDLPNKLLM